MRNAFLVFIALVCGSLTLLFALTAMVTTNEALSVRDTPLRADMAEAVRLAKSGKSAWVQLTDAAADCKRYSSYPSRWEDTIRQSGSFIAHNPTKDTELAVLVHDVKMCEYLGAVHYIGVVKKLDAEQRRVFATYGLPLSETHGPQWWLCTWCVPERDWAVVIVSLIIAALTALMTFKVWRARKSVPPSEPANKSLGAQPGRANKKRRSR